jgi:hypothetical protein
MFWRGFDSRIFVGFKKVLIQGFGEVLTQGFLLVSRRF